MKSDGETNQLIRVSGLSKSFGSQEVLKNISFTLDQKENLAVLGKSGTGKSVLIKCLVGLLRPDSGEVQVFGQNVPDLELDELNGIRKRIGFLFQSAALYDSMSVRENLEFPLQRVKKETNKKVLTEKVEEVLANVKLTEAIDKMPAQLSGGMRKRIGLARTLIMNPEIILYDEPTTGLDPITTHEICELINEVREKYHSASITITHDPIVARSVTDRMMFIRDGTIYAEGSMEELKQQQDEWVQSFLNE